MAGASSTAWNRTSASSRRWPRGPDDDSIPEDARSPLYAIWRPTSGDPAVIAAATKVVNTPVRSHLKYLDLHLGAHVADILPQHLLRLTFFFRHKISNFGVCWTCHIPYIAQGLAVVRGLCLLVMLSSREYFKKDLETNWFCPPRIGQNPTAHGWCSSR